MPESLVRSTDIDVLPADHTLTRGDGYWVVTSPSNPSHYWGNLLIFDDAPVAGDRPRWEAVFTREFGGRRGIEHRTFAWDRRDGELGAAVSEFSAHGYAFDHTVGLVAHPAEIRRLASENRDLEVAVLDGDSHLWDGVAALWRVQNAAGEDPHPAEAYERYTRARLAELRALIAARRGTWVAALDRDLVVGSLGIIVIDGRARYQAVDTLPSHRRRGIAARLVVDAAEVVLNRSVGTGAAGTGGDGGLGGRPVTDFVIAADPDYHAIGLYERLGFVRREHVCGVWRGPDAATT